MIKSKRMKLAGYVERMGPKEVYVGFWWEGQKERNDWEDQNKNGWIILRWILEI
jgi:hypothetical protein